MEQIISIPEFLLAFREFLEQIDNEKNILGTTDFIKDFNNKKGFSEVRECRI